MEQNPNHQADNQQEFINWKGLLQGIHKISPTLIRMKYRKPYDIAKETGQCIIEDTQSSKNQKLLSCATYLAYTTLQRTKISLPHSYWVWHKNQQPRISPNGRYIAALCYSEKEYALIDTATNKIVSVPRIKNMHICLTNTGLYSATANGFFEEMYPIKKSSFDTPIYTYPEPLLDSFYLPTITASTDGVAWAVASSGKNLYMHRKIGTTFFTDTVTLPENAGNYQIIVASQQCIVGINRNASSPLQSHPHCIGQRTESALYGEDPLEITEFSYPSALSGAVSPDGAILALGLIDESLALFSLKKERTPQLLFTIRHVGSLISWNSTLGHPIICYGKQSKKEKRGNGITYIYPYSIRYIFGKHSSSTNQ